MYSRFDDENNTAGDEFSPNPPVELPDEEYDYFEEDNYDAYFDDFYDTGLEDHVDENDGPFCDPQDGDYN